MNLGLANVAGTIFILNANIYLSPTDCVKDRLASYIHFKERSCFDQAILVAKNHPVNLISIKKWCIAEGSEESYDEFKKKIGRRMSVRAVVKEECATYWNY